MKVYLCIATGGFFGAISRYLLKNISILDYRGDFPLNTLLVNISGSLVLAFVLTLAMLGIRMDNSVKLGISVGFLGSFTTFSALCKELSVLLSSQNFGMAFLYISGSVILGLSGIYVGITLARAMIRIIAKSNTCRGIGLDISTDNKKSNNQKEVE